MLFSPNQQIQKQNDNLTGQIVHLVQDKDVTKGLIMPVSWKTHPTPAKKHQKDFYFILKHLQV